MIKLDYGALLCPEPITLSIGTLRNPKLREIGKLSFEKFGYYEFLLKLTPELYFTKIKGNDESFTQDSFAGRKKAEVTLYDILLEDGTLCEMYTEMFNFFFIEQVLFREGFFILLKEEIQNGDDIEADNIRGVITEDTMSQVLGLIQQICCIYDEEEQTEEIQFKNNLAKRLFEKMQKAKQKKNESKKTDVNFSLPNIISALSNKHPSISPVNVWDLTVFQLLDSFNRLQANALYDIDSVRVSVWGDEKNAFDASRWYRNEYEKNNGQQ